MGFKFNPLTGSLDIVGSGGGGGSSAEQIVQYITLTSADETNKSVTLSNTPLNADKVMLDPVGGPAQQYGVDFTVSGTTLSWASLGLDGILEEGDVLRISYMVDNE